MKKSKIYIINSQNRIFELKPSFFCEINWLANASNTIENKGKIVESISKHYDADKINDATVFIRDLSPWKRLVKTHHYQVIETFSLPSEAKSFVELCQKKIEIINKNRLLKKFGKKYQIGENAIGQTDEVLTCADTYILKTKDFKNNIEW